VRVTMSQPTGYPRWLAGLLAFTGAGRGMV
jgi:hypothetical protein